jgi:hypothetical protein
MLQFHNALTGGSRLHGMISSKDPALLSFLPVLLLAEEQVVPWV